METSATWELSIAWRATPESLQSKLQSWTRSLIASTIYNHQHTCHSKSIVWKLTFFRRSACSRRASNTENPALAFVCAMITNVADVTYFLPNDGLLELG
jgi:hypothetical protein